MSSVDPITEFLNARERAAAHQVDTAPVALATADASGRPSARMVLLRGVDERGFTFFTNYNSRKSRDLDGNPNAALCFYWVALDEQIRQQRSRLNYYRVTAPNSGAVGDIPVNVGDRVIRSTVLVPATTCRAWTTPATRPPTRAATTTATDRRRTWASG